MPAATRPGARRLAAAAPFILPHLAGFSLFMLFPVLGTFGISLLDWNMVNPPTFAGLGNYGYMLTRDPFFWKAMGNTLYYTAGAVALILAASLGSALALNRDLKGRDLFRTLYFVPNVSSLVAVSLVWLWLYNADYGPINGILRAIGITGPRWLSDTRSAMPAVMLMSAWTQFGFFTIIFLAGLQAIPRQLYEAAELDGSGPGRTFARITLPLLSPTTFFVLVMSVINSFQVFEQTFVMTKGGPAFSTTTAVMYIYSKAFKFQQVGYASALSWALFACILAVTLVQLYAQKRWVHYES
jgi:multiple sugar transport system permease protein